MEAVTIFGALDVEYESTLGGQLTFQTDLPGNAMAVREEFGIVAASWRVVRFRMRPTTRGHLYNLKIVPYFGSIMRIYNARIWARTLPGTQWQWYAVPLPPTTEWAPVKMEIPPMGEWAPVKMDITPITDWNPVKMAIPPTTDWNPRPMAIKPTPPNPEWVDVQVDA